jgi:hypothetical protein
MNMDLSVVTNFLENKNVTATVSLLLALYAGLAAPALPNVVISFFDTFLGKVLFIFLIAFVASKNVQVAIMLAVAFVVTLNVANKRYAESFMNIERFENEDFDTEEEDENENENEDFDADEEEDENENENEDFDVEEEDENEGFDVEEEDEDENEDFDAEEEDENEGFTNPHAFSSLDENFENPTELFTDNKKNKNTKEGVVPADNLSGNPSKMFAPF